MPDQPAVMFAIFLNVESGEGIERLGRLQLNYVEVVLWNPVKELKGIPCQESTDPPVPCGIR